MLLCPCVLCVLRMLLRMSVYWLWCVGAWYLPGSRRTARARCSSAPATAAVRIYWWRNLTRCIYFETLLSGKLLHFYQYVLCVVSDHFFYPKDPLIKGQRCVILADGFYEWKKQEKGKQPFFIYFPQTPGKKEDQNDPTTSALNNNSETACPPEEASPDLTEVSSGFSIVI